MYFRWADSARSNWEYLDFFQKVTAQIHYMFLPVLCYTIESFATLTILMKNSLMENLGQDYVRTAYAKGLSEQRVIFVHALRNSLIPIATGLGSEISLILAGSFLIEKVFNIDGMGYLGYTSILQRDYPVALGILVIASLLLLVGNILSDMIYVIVDPQDSVQVSTPRTQIANLEETSAVDSNRRLSGRAAVRSRFFASDCASSARIKRGYYSFLILLVAYVVSFFLPLLVNNTALGGALSRAIGIFPWPITIRRRLLARRAIGEPDYRALARDISPAEARQLGAPAALPLQPHGIPARSARQPAESAVAAAHFRHRRSRPRHLRAAGIRLQRIALFRAAGAGHQPGHRA